MSASGCSIRSRRYRRSGSSRDHPRRVRRRFGEWILIEPGEILAEALQAGLADQLIAQQRMDARGMIDVVTELACPKLDARGAQQPRSPVLLQRAGGVAFAG